MYSVETRIHVQICKVFTPVAHAGSLRTFILRSLLSRPTDHNGRPSLDFRGGDRAESAGRRQELDLPSSGHASDPEEPC